MLPSVSVQNPALGWASPFAWAWMLGAAATAAFFVICLCYGPAGQRLPAAGLRPSRDEEVVDAQACHNSRDAGRRPRCSGKAIVRCEVGTQRCFQTSTWPDRLPQGTGTRPVPMCRRSAQRRSPRAPMPTGILLVAELL